MNSLDYTHFVVDHRIKVLYVITDTLMTLNESFNDMLAIESKNIRLVCDSNDNSNLNNSPPDELKRSNTISIYGLKMNYDDNLKEIDDTIIYITNLSVNDSIRIEAIQLLNTLLNACKSFSGYVKVSSIIYQCINFIMCRLHYVSSSVAVLKIELYDKHEAKSLKKIYNTELNALKHYIANVRVCGEIARLVDKLFISDELIPSMKIIMDRCIQSLIWLYEVMEKIVTRQEELFYKMFVHKSLPIGSVNLKTILMMSFKKHEQILDYENWIERIGTSVNGVEDERLMNVCNGDC